MLHKLFEYLIYRSFVCVTEDGTIPQTIETQQAASDCLWSDPAKAEREVLQ